MKKIANHTILAIIFVLVHPSFEQYWDDFNQYIWDPNYFGLNSNIVASQQQKNPIITAIKQTISSTNDENNGLGAFIGSYKENKTETKPEPSQPQIQQPTDLKPEVSKPQSTEGKPEDLTFSKPQNPTPVNIKPIPEDPPSKPLNKPMPVHNQEGDKEFNPPNMGLFYPNSPLFFATNHIPQFHPLIFNHPLFPFPFHLPGHYQHLGPAPIQVPVQLPVESRPAQNGPFSIQQPTITQNGETIVENLIGGLDFNCQGRATGHFRDVKFCDVFHACVFGKRKKTYACPFVGEAQYFDDANRRCEFVRYNPQACELNEFYN
ncbi:hypothetical protein BpHYR1_033795 [Brachionus plicatilis]|uniref:Chitin-binding type-2 domain-containing protein n=1 Tax=Brachionus plicatilis TaxID=10195 RepID=A0A3M7Q7R4_BRAPC|nr:hypothetical protein BpHYR1_033795 [Brachionus plicatilis]